MTEEAPPAPQPVQIVSLGGENGAVVTFHEEALQGILDKVPQDIKIAIVSVNGIFRSGKSFLLNFFLRYLLHGNSTNSSTAWMNGNGDVLVEGNANDSANGHMAGGFEWRGGANRHTTGIWMWSEPFVRRDPASNEDIAILLMDTQGLHDTNTGRNANTFIFAVSTLLSSYQIYNVKGQIGEDHLGDLALFAAYAQCGRQAEAATNIKPFQRVEFLVRDWPNFENVNDDDMIRRDTENYLSDIMGFRGDEGLQETRNKINQCFDEVNCFLLPHPGLDVAQRNFDGRIDAITDAFKRRLNCFVRHVFDESLFAKEINGCPITASELLCYFKEYKNIFSSGGDLPESLTILQATAEVNNRNAAGAAAKLYVDAMEEVVGDKTEYCKYDELAAKQDEAKRNALALYEQRATLGKVESIDAIREELMQLIEDKRNLYINKNQKKAPFLIVAIFNTVVEFVTKKSSSGVILALLCAAVTMVTTGGATMVLSGLVSIANACVAYGSAFGVGILTPFASVAALIGSTFLGVGMSILQFGTAILISFGAVVGLPYYAYRSILRWCTSKVNAALLIAGAGASNLFPTSRLAISLSMVLCASMMIFHCFKICLQHLTKSEEL